MSHWTVTRKAAKQHVCEWCGTAIEKGESHSAHSGVLYGDFYAYRTHPDCDEAIGRDDHHESYGEYELCMESHMRGKTCEETEQAARHAE